MSSPQNSHQKSAVLVFGIALLIVFVALGSEAAFNLHFLHPRGSTQIVLFAGLSLIVFLLLVALLFLLFRNILKLYADQRSNALGSRLRARLMLGALLLSFAPVVAMFLFSYILMNRSIDRWFSQPVTTLREDADNMAEQLQHYAMENARAEADALSQEPGIAAAIAANGAAAATQDDMVTAFRDHKVTLQGGFALLFKNGLPLATYQLPQTDGPITLLVDGRVLPASDANGAAASTGPDGTSDFAQQVLRVAQRGDEPILRIPVAHAEDPAPYIVAVAPVHGGGLILVGLPLPQGMPATIERIREGTRDYFALGRARRGVRSTFMLVLILLTTAIFFASSWLALFLSRQITRPVESIADAMAEIAAGQYSFRLQQPISTNELGTLATSFNAMASDLETSRNRLDASRAELSEANLALDARRVEIETLLDTIPLAVASLSLDSRIVHSNRAFVELFADNLSADVTNRCLLELLPEEALPEFQRLMRRSHRMGLASSEVEARIENAEGQRLRTLSVTVASLERRGYILVMEDVTDLLRAQKQVAWREVAQRVAHEIKNPLTPISLAAERVRRYAERGTLLENAATVRDSSETIVRSVEVLRQLVDQFALLARFPAPQLRPVDLHQVIEDTLRVFDGRMEDVRIVKLFDPSLPPVIGDARALQRALANLVDNAAEAMQNSLHRELTLQTCLNPAGTMAEIVISDTGTGLSEEVREHLFLPWFSTKQRGSGLGLAITSQVMEEHRGSIRAEKNHPVGARFILELPLADSTLTQESAQPAETSLTP
jgi:nitrogen fixation/metabolism regulation signal transduction histidine kinase